ncbi:hypothetical protein [Faecalibacterium sp. I3-3-89]|uniref:hypothetical protein n=1 Tax=Faecalibacterium sp. I3-3-89 TaxID=2929493 RepID=UPI002014B1B4|nr:hypothetical protein [Faecalibacterium sp. I3-3-89]UQK41860.1 hypothetical protein MTP38_06940 [Faecalibacterium sp. I3-3-89]
MKRKKFLALALAGVMTAATLTACAPLEDLYDWFFGSGSGSASHGSEKGLVRESEELNNKLEPLKAYLELSETTVSDKAKETLEAVAKKFDAEWLIDGELVNKPAIDAALGSIMKDKLLNQQLCVDVMEWPSSDGTAVTDPGHRMIYVGSYKDRGPDPDTGVPSYDSRLTKYSFLKAQLKSLNINNAELYAGTFQKGDKTYAAMVIIF